MRTSPTSSRSWIIWPWRGGTCWWQFTKFWSNLKLHMGKPNTMSLFQNDTLFCSPFPVTKAPETLFYRIEQCQEIQMMAQDPYTAKHIIGNAVQLLTSSGIVPIKEFDTWEAMQNKMYPLLKTFIHEAYSRRLIAIQILHSGPTRVRTVEHVKCIGYQRR